MLKMVQTVAWVALALSLVHTSCHPLQPDPSSDHAPAQNTAEPDTIMPEKKPDDESLKKHKGKSEDMHKDKSDKDSKDSTEHKPDSTEHKPAYGEPGNNPMSGQGKMGTWEGAHHTAVIMTFHQVRNLEMTNIRYLRDAQGKGQFDLYLLFDDKMSQDDVAQITKLELPMIPASKSEMQQFYGEKVYEEYSGIYDAPVKPMALKWIVESTYAFTWVVESDVVYTGDWAKFFGAHNQNQADLIATYTGHQGEPDWPNAWFWKSCTICDDANHMGAFLSIHRISNRFANDVQQLLVAGHTGHHEAFIGTCCKLVGSEHCVSEDIANSYIGRVTYRPSIPESELVEADKLYHPVKELKSQNGKQTVFFDQSKYAKYYATAIAAVSTISTANSTEPVAITAIGSTNSTQGPSSK